MTTEMREIKYFVIDVNNTPEATQIVLHDCFGCPFKEREICSGMDNRYGQASLRYASEKDIEKVKAEAPCLKKLP